MEFSNKFIQKSLKSFDNNKFYQAVREFNSGLLRDIEHNTFSSIEAYYDAVLPILEANSLFHESEQIIQYYFTHLKKHKNLNKGFKPIIKFLLDNLISNQYPNCTFKFFNGFLDFVSSSPEVEIIDYIKVHYNDFLVNSKNFSLYEDVEQKVFKTLILLSLFDEAESMAYSYYLNDLKSEKNFDYIVYSLVILAINGKIEQSTKILQELRKELPIEVQKDSILFQCCSEFILASSSKDFDWTRELQVHFSDILKDKVLKLIIMNLIKVIFPEETKISIFDIFK